MKQTVVFITLSYLFIISSAHARFCNYDLRFLIKSSRKLEIKTNKYSEAQLKDEIGRLENFVEEYRKKKENPESAIGLYYRKIISEVDAHIATESFGVAQRLLRTDFRDLEFGYYYIKKFTPILKKLKSALSTDQDISIDEAIKRFEFNSTQEQLIKGNFSDFKKVKGLVDELNTAMLNEKLKVAKTYQGYSYYREHLDSILEDINCTDQKCKDGTSKLLDKLGVNNLKEQERFPTIFKGEKRPSVREVQKLISSDNFMNVVRLRIERNFEVSQFYSNLILQPQLVDMLFRKIINLPGVRYSRIVRLFKIIYDRQARELYFPKINKIVRSKNLDPKDLLGLMRELNSTIDGDELIIAFSRRIDNKTRDVWKELKATADELDPSFAKRMDAAKTKAFARGGISSVYTKSYVSNLAAVLSIGGSITYSYFDFNKVKEISEEIDLDNEKIDLETEVHNIDIFDEETEKDLQALEALALGQNSN